MNNTINADEYFFNQEVRLFETKAVTTDPSTHQFWEHLASFHRSYTSFLAPRTTQPGTDSPRRIRVAVLDSGVDFNHPGIVEARDRGRIREEWCRHWVGPSVRDETDSLHGTGCAYLLYKTAPEVDIYVGKVLRQMMIPLSEFEQIPKAIDYAVNVWNVDIISLSLGVWGPHIQSWHSAGEGPHAPERIANMVDDMERAIRDAAYKSCIIFSSASNFGKNIPRSFPANLKPWVFAVHASDGNGHPGSLNPEPQEGFSIMTLGMNLALLERYHFIGFDGRLKTHYYGNAQSGTSFAVPIAAGMAAIVLDLAMRVDEISPRAKRKIWRPENMEKVLRLMSTPKDGGCGRLHYYVAPWLHWKPGWENDGYFRRWVWDAINILF